MDDDERMRLLNEKIEWMGELYEAAKDQEMYQWAKASNVRHRCGGDIFVYVETTGVGYVCENCKEAEVL